jgi:hypothetical protein
MVDSDKAIGDLHVEDLLTGPVSETQLDLAQRRWNDETISPEGARIAQAFERSQAQAAALAAAAAAALAPPVIVIDDDDVAAPMPPPAAAAMDMSPIVIDTSSDEEKDDAAVAQSRSSPKNGKKRARGMRLAEFGRSSMAKDYKRGALQAVQANSQAVETNSQEILPPPGSQDVSQADSQSDVHADWIHTNSANGAAATGVERQADDADDVPVFGGNGGNGARRTFDVEADGSALLTDTHANGTKQTSRWTSIGHGQWEKRDKDSV